MSPRDNRAKSKRKSSPKRILKRAGGKGGKGGKDDDSSVDSQGNMRNLIDYDYTSDDSSDSSVSTPSRGRSPRQPRKAAIVARKKINKLLSKEVSKEERSSFMGVL